MSAREHILARLLQSKVSVYPDLPDVANWFKVHQRSEGIVQRTERLRSALEAVHTEIHEVTHANWTDVLLHVASRKGLRQLLIGSNTPHGFELQSCQTGGLQLISYDTPIDTWRDLLFDGVDSALTFARGAIAEPGSLILWPSPSEPRLMSLVPSTHFVLLDVDTIYADFYAAMTAEGWAKGMPTNALLVCGPSKTADIQQTLAYGAHGPKELVVLLRQTLKGAA
nr:lactate utilization protein [uncultured Rhodoferax sp.]